MAHLPDLTRQNHCARLLQRRDIAIGQVNHIDEAGLFSDFSHVHGFFIISGQRLFA